MTAEKLPPEMVMLFRQVDGLEAGLKAQAEALVDVTAATEMLEQQLGELAGSLSRLASRWGDEGGDGEERAESPPPWLDVTDATDATERLRALVLWLDRIYTKYRTGELPHCWAFHPAVVDELMALQGAWVAAHFGERASAGAAMDWRARYRPDAVLRIQEEVGDCSLRQHVHGGAMQFQASRLHGAEMVDEIAVWWATTHGGTAAPAATEAMVRAADARIEEADAHTRGGRR